MVSIKELCLTQTTLTAEHAAIIEDFAKHLQLIADVSQSDVFIDCPLTDKGSALVVAQSFPSTAPSLYQTSVVGQLAYSNNEPAVLFSLVSGQPVIGSRGISQEQIAMQQHVVPIRAEDGQVIGVLIMEQDISEKVEQERNVERLLLTTERLSETLLTVAMSEGSMQSLMHEGIILFDEQEKVTYTNPRAREILHDIGHTEEAEGRTLNELFYRELEKERLLNPTGVIQKELKFGHIAFVVKAVSIYREQKAVGGLMLLRDISELVAKEKQLTIKSAVIKEIHHRVKNNLQTVSSLLRLQMRRTKLPEVEKVYRDSINRINSIAVIHEMLAYEGLDSIVFNDVVERIAKNVISSMAKPDQTIRASIFGDELSLPSDTATTLALVVNELIQNCVMHAFAERDQGEIDISIANKSQIVSLRVSDNGIGLDAAGRQERKGHLGLKISEMLVQENLSGVLTIASDDRGTSVQITFPLSRALPEEDKL
ncbi:histidine kinase [Cohnella pontilimi]|uniref:histidine kinase n=1 Tax=Cohnella pontilimi TaxID=2564100 RepID=A0A4U0FGG6_9BACL|nr:sensor histidine kinase [Cohnella pontilimi]TJY43960.1 histidine kinase [Cohnella pontilimi]